MTTSNVNDWYSTAFKSWQGKLVGPKPTADQLTTVHRLQARPGKQALAIAMGLRDCGVTGSQIVIACGAPQLNKMRGFIDDKLLKRLPAAPDAKHHTVYKLELTAKGQARIDAAIKREAASAEAEKAPAETAKPKPAKKAGSSKLAKAVEAASKPKGARKPKAKGDQPTSTAALSEAANATATVAEVNVVPADQPLLNEADQHATDNNS